MYCFAVRDVIPQLYMYPSALYCFEGLFLGLGYVQLGNI
jgi:hypothetical protein